MKALEFIDVSLRLGKSPILDKISFEVERGQIYGLIGHNGAGKTSLIRILLGLTTNYKGKLRIMSGDDLDEKRKLIGEVLDSMGADKSLTAESYLRRIGYMFGGTSRGGEKGILEKVGLSDTGNKRISQFSLGMKRRLMIAGALVGDPEILVLDEPFNGVDAEGMADMRLMLSQLASEGMTILVTSHNIPELIKLATAFGVMYKGKFLDSITYDRLAGMIRKKTIFKTDDPRILTEKIKKDFPQYSCHPTCPGEISIFDEIDPNEREKIRRALPDGIIKDISVNTMSEEEILLWKMNGCA